MFAPSSSEFIPFLTCHHSITDFEINAFLNRLIQTPQVCVRFSFNFRHWLILFHLPICHQPETRAVGHPCNPCNPCNPQKTGTAFTQWLRKDSTWLRKRGLLSHSDSEKTQRDSAENGDCFHKVTQKTGTAFTRWFRKRGLLSQSDSENGDCFHTVTQITWTAFTKWLREWGRFRSWKRAASCSRRRTALYNGLHTIGEDKAHLRSDQTH